ncbi:MAG: hypothetical protein QXT46_00520 [Pyrobaculum sp.]
MWSLAFGVVSVIIVAWAVLYASLHTPSVYTIDVAERLYKAKWELEDVVQTPDSVVFNFTLFKNRVNVVWAQWVNFTLPNGSSLTLAAPRGARLSSLVKNVLYQVEAYVEKCIPGAFPSGEPATIYIVKFRHSIDPLAWVETYAVLYNNETIRRYFLFTKGDHLLKVERFMVYNTTSKTTTIYIIAPRDALGVYLVDYPLWIPLSCYEEVKHSSHS